MQSSFKHILGTPSAPLTLTASEVAGSYLQDISGMEKATIYAAYVPAADSRNLTLAVYFSIDGGTSWIPECVTVAGTPSGTVSTAVYPNVYTVAGTTHATTYRVRIPVAIRESGILNSTGKGVLMKVTAKEDGVGTFGTVMVSVSLYGAITRG